MTGVPPKSVERSRVCTTEVSWYSSRSTTRNRFLCSATTCGTRSQMASANATWSLYSTSPRRVFSSWNRTARSTSGGSAPTAATASAAGAFLIRADPNGSSARPVNDPASRTTSAGSATFSLMARLREMTACVMGSTPRPSSSSRGSVLSTTRRRASCQADASVSTTDSASRPMRVALSRKMPFANAL